MNAHPAYQTQLQTRTASRCNKCGLPSHPTTLTRAVLRSHGVKQWCCSNQSKDNTGSNFKSEHLQALRRILRDQSHHVDNFFLKNYLQHKPQEYFDSLLKFRQQSSLKNEKQQQSQSQKQTPQQCQSLPKFDQSSYALSFFRIGTKNVRQKYSQDLQNAGQSHQLNPDMNQISMQKKWNVCNQADLLKFNFSNDLSLEMMQIQGSEQDQFYLEYKKGGFSSYELVRQQQRLGDAQSARKVMDGGNVGVLSNPQSTKLYSQKSSKTAYCMSLNQQQKLQQIREELQKNNPNVIGQSQSARQLSIVGNDDEDSKIIEDGEDFSGGESNPVSKQKSTNLREGEEQIGSRVNYDDNIGENQENKGEHNGLKQGVLTQQSQRQFNAELKDGVQQMEYIVNKQSQQEDEEEHFDEEEKEFVNKDEEEYVDDDEEECEDDVEGQYEDDGEEDFYPDNFEEQVNDDTERCVDFTVKFDNQEAQAGDEDEEAYMDNMEMLMDEAEESETDEDEDQVLDEDEKCVDEDQNQVDDDKEQDFQEDDEFMDEEEEYIAQENDEEENEEGEEEEEEDLGQVEPEEQLDDDDTEEELLGEDELLGKGEGENGMQEAEGILATENSTSNSRRVDKLVDSLHDNDASQRYSYVMAQKISNTESFLKDSKLEPVQTITKDKKVQRDDIIHQTQGEMDEDEQVMEEFQATKDIEEQQEGDIEEQLVEDRFASLDLEKENQEVIMESTTQQVKASEDALWCKKNWTPEDGIYDQPNAYVSEIYKAAGILPYMFDKRGQLNFLVGKYKTKNKKGSAFSEFKFIGGKREDKEDDPRVTACRETSEETGNQLQEQDVFHLLSQYYWVESGNYVLFLFELRHYEDLSIRFSQWVSDGGKIVEGEKTIGLQWITYNELVNKDVHQSRNRMIGIVLQSTLLQNHFIKMMENFQSYNDIEDEEEEQEELELTKDELAFLYENMMDDQYQPSWHRSRDQYKKQRFDNKKKQDLRQYDIDPSEQRFVRQKQGGSQLGTKSEGEKVKVIDFDELLSEGRWEKIS